MAKEQLEGAEVARRLGRSSRFVNEWAGRYRRGELAPGKPPGASPQLSLVYAERLTARPDAGPFPADGVCTLCGKDARRILAGEHGMRHKIGSVYSVLRRIGYSRFAPWTRHQKNTSAAKTLKRESSCWSGSRPKWSLRTAKARGFFADKAQFGRQGTLAGAWVQTGHRPTAVTQVWRECVNLYAAFGPATGESVALLTPTVDTGTFDTLLKMMADATKAEEHAVLVMDRAGRQESRILKLPDWAAVVLLPPYSLELNPVGEPVAPPAVVRNGTTGYTKATITCSTPGPERGDGCPRTCSSPSTYTTSSERAGQL